MCLRSWLSQTILYMLGLLCFGHTAIFIKSFDVTTSFQGHYQDHFLFFRSLLAITSLVAAAVSLRTALPLKFPWECHSYQV
jgi:hypothetical protein